MTDYNVVGSGRFCGVTDPPLNAQGLAEASELRAILANTEIRAAYTSALLRARQTVEIMVAARGIPVLIDPRLNEISYGAWEGVFVYRVRSPRSRCRASRTSG